MSAMNMNIAPEPRNIEASFPAPENRGSNYWPTVCLFGFGISVIVNRSLGWRSPRRFLFCYESSNRLSSSSDCKTESLQIYPFVGIDHVHFFERRTEKTVCQWTMILPTPMSLPFTWNMEFSPAFQRNNFSVFGTTATRFLLRSIGYYVGDFDLTVFLPPDLHTLLAHYNNFHSQAAGMLRESYPCDRCCQYTASYKGALSRHHKSKRCIRNTILRQQWLQYISGNFYPDSWERRLVMPPEQFTV